VAPSLSKAMDTKQKFTATYIPKSHGQLKQFILQPAQKQFIAHI
jgi:hypothetical protein